MTKLNVKDLVCREYIHDPHTDAVDPSIKRVRQGYPQPFEVDELWGFLRIRGKRRTVLVGKDNVASMLLVDEPEVAEAKGKK